MAKTVSGVDLGAAPPEAKPEKPTKEPDTRAFGVRLPADLADDFDAICSDLGVKRSPLVRFALAQFVADYRAGKVKIPQRTVADI